MSNPEPEYTIAHPTLSTPKPSGWRCELFGMQGCITLRPTEGNVPNWFWRKMQYLAFGNLWIKEH